MHPALQAGKVGDSAGQGDDLLIEFSGRHAC
jgi:hypothetical protein